MSYLHRAAWDLLAPWLPSPVRGPCAVLLAPAGSVDDVTAPAADGVVCRPCLTASEHDFHVELQMAPLKVKLLELGRRTTAALAAELQGRFHVELTACDANVGGKLCVTLHVRIPGRRVHTAWLGNTLARALRGELRTTELVFVTVSTVRVRAWLVRDSVAFVQSKWNPNADHENQAWHLEWRPSLACTHVEWRDACDPGAAWEVPVTVCGLAVIRIDAKPAASKAGGDDAASDLDAVLGKLPDAAAKMVRQRQADCKGVTDDSLTKQKAWLAAVARLPVGKMSPALVPAPDPTKLSAALKRAGEALDAAAHGMPEAKAAVMGIVAQIARAPGSRLRALGLYGPPGCGKTTFVTRGLAQALGRPARVISLGGAKDSCVLVGHDFTYSSARQGRVVDAVADTGVMDPVLVFDELDKVSGGAAGDEIVNVLMRLVDPTVNAAFEDTYLAGVPLDLSRAMVVFTFNDAALVNPVLLDRINLVRVADVSEAEKRKIVEEHLLPRMGRDLGVRCQLVERALDELMVSQAASSHTGLRRVEKVLERAAQIANMRALHLQDAADIKIEAADVKDAARAVTAGEGQAAMSSLSMYS